MSAPYVRFREEFYKRTTTHVCFIHEQVWQSSVAFRLVIPWNNGQCFIQSIRTLEQYRGNGSGSRGLKFLTALADKHKIKLYCVIDPFGDKPRMTKPQLKAWYKRNGFVLTGDLKDEMVREPK